MSGAPGERSEVEAGVVLRSEFAVVRVSVDRSANGDRLRVEDVRSGRSFCLDPLELERLTTIRHRDLGDVVSPSRDEWPAGTDLLAAAGKDPFTGNGR